MPPEAISVQCLCTILATGGPPCSTVSRWAALPAMLLLLPLELRLVAAWPVAGLPSRLSPPPPPFANLCVPTRRTAAPPLAAESSPVHGVRAHACRYRAVLLEMSKGQQDYEHARRLNAPRRQGQLGTLYNFVKGLLQGRGFDSSYADMSGCVHVNRQTPQLSVSDTQVPWDCTGHIRGGFISMEMQI